MRLNTLGGSSVPYSNSYSSKVQFSDEDQIKLGAQTLREFSELDGALIDLAEQALVEGDHGTWNRPNQVGRVREVAEQYKDRNPHLYHEQ